MRCWRIAPMTYVSPQIGTGSHALLAFRRGPRSEEPPATPLIRSPAAVQDVADTSLNPRSQCPKAPATPGPEPGVRTGSAARAASG
jgi:hypothetical protein